MTKYKSNNIVLLIGNGFDLAHFSDNKQTTSYNDFANDIVLKISNEIEIFLDKRDGYYSNHNNIFGTIQELEQQSIIQDDIKFLSINFKSHLFINFINNENEDDIVTGINYYLIIEYYKNNTLQKYLLENKGLICKFISNQFLGKLYDNQYKNWFDIENAYFQEIINIKNKYKSRNSEYKKRELLKLNQLNKD